MGQNRFCDFYLTNAPLHLVAQENSMMTLPIGVFVARLMAMEPVISKAFSQEKLGAARV